MVEYHPRDFRDAIRHDDFDVLQRLLLRAEWNRCVGDVDAVDPNRLQRPSLWRAGQVETSGTGDAAHLERPDVLNLRARRRILSQTEKVRIRWQRGYLKRLPARIATP